MNCRHVKKHLSAYVDCELAGDEMLIIRHHLTGCDECSAEYENIKKTKHLLSSLQTVIPREAFCGDIINNIGLSRRAGFWTLQNIFGVSLRQRVLRTGMVAVLSGLVAFALYFNGSGPVVPSHETQFHRIEVNSEMPIGVFSSSADLPCIPYCMRNNNFMLMEEHNKKERNLEFASDMYQ